MTLKRATHTIEELRDAVNKREITISKLLSEKAADEQAIAHLKGTLHEQDELRKASHKVIQDNVALQGQVSTLRSAREGLERQIESLKIDLRKAEDERTNRESTLQFRAGIVQTMLSHCTLNETIAKDAILVLQGGVEGVTWRL